MVCCAWVIQMLRLYCYTILLGVYLRNGTDKAMLLQCTFACCVLVQTYKNSLILLK